jgi:hypothetical protein
MDGETIARGLVLVLLLYVAYSFLSGTGGVKSVPTGTLKSLTSTSGRVPPVGSST